jgi:hypothetical protein
VHLAGLSGQAIISLKFATLPWYKSLILAFQLATQDSQTLVETEKEKPAKEPVEQLLAKQEPGGVVQRTDSGTLNSPRPSWWWVELWSAKRPLVKEGVAHGLSFAGVVVFLEGAHRLLKWSSLPPEELYVFTKVHFYMFAIILVVFALGLIIKVLNSELLGKAYEAKNH